MPYPTIPLEAIIIPPDRQRQEFDPEGMSELMNDIAANGLLHAIVLRDDERGSPCVLVAGERRLRAMKMLHEMEIPFKYAGTPVGVGQIPFTPLGALTALEAEEVELSENLKRRDLTWQELAAAHARLHALRQKQKAATIPPINDPGFVDSKPTQTIADTAKEVFGRSDGAFHETVRREVIVAKHLDNPAVAKAKSLDEAFKVLKRADEAQRNAALGEAVGKTFTADIHELHKGNCLELMESMPSGIFDVILTDPPYGMGAESFGDGGGKMTGIQHTYDDSPETWHLLMKVWCADAFRLAKPQAHAYVFCDIDRFHDLKAHMTAAGWDVFRTPFIVHKINSGRVPRPDCGPRRQWEMILYAIKGSKPVNAILPDVISCEGDENLGHGAQKPVALYQDLLRRSVRPGDVVLDSFCGTGTIFPAAHSLKCKAVGIEQADSAYGIAVQRLQRIKNAEAPALF